MTALLSAELLKLRTTRTFVALAAAAVGLSLLITVLMSTLTEPSASDVLTDVFANDVSGPFILALAIVGITGEWRHRTITSSLLAAPDRTRFLLAKTLAFAAAGVVLSILISSSVTAIGFTILSARDLPTPELGQLAELIWRSALIAALLAAFGVGVGALVRNQAVAMVGVLVFGFVVEPAVLALASDVGRFGPVLALPSALADDPPEELLTPVPAALAMLGWILAAFGAGAALLRGRDLD
jgi:ABC-type transport system involved in multi-copper enzyme maturation permease subunit